MGKGKPRFRLPVVQPEDQAIKLIALTQGQETTISASRYEWAMQWLWHARWNPLTHSFYAARTECRNGECRILGLHKAIVQPRDGMIADHINGNTLDNRDDNLREVTPSQSAKNQGVFRGSKTGIRGVTIFKPNNTFIVRITHQGKTHYRGEFKTLELAAEARKKAVLEFHGEYARPGDGEIVMEQAALSLPEPKSWPGSTVQSLRKIFPFPRNKAYEIIALSRALDRLVEGELDGSAMPPGDAVEFLRSKLLSARIELHGRPKNYTPHLTTWLNQSRYLRVIPAESMPENFLDAVTVLKRYPNVSKADLTPQEIVDGYMSDVRLIDTEIKRLGVTHGTRASMYLFHRVEEFAACVSRWPTTELQFIPSIARFMKEKRYEQDPKFWHRNPATGFSAERDQLRRLA